MSECKNINLKLGYYLYQNDQAILCYTALSELLDRNIKMNLTESDIFRAAMYANKGHLNPVIIDRYIRKLNEENKESIIIDNSKSLMLCNIYLKTRIATRDVLRYAFNNMHEMTENDFRSEVLSKLHIKWHSIIYDEITELLEGK